MRLAVTLALAFLVAAALAGCTSTPQNLREGSTRTDHQLKLPPAQAAGCFARNTENNNRFLTATTRALPGDKWEIVVRAPEAPILGAIYLVEIEPSGTGSRASIWGPTPAPGEVTLRTTSPLGC